MSVKEHRRGDVVVAFDDEVCIHAAECVRGLPKVFTPGQRPWIHLENASPEDVEAVIRRCPSGALTFRREKMTQPSPPPPTSVKVTVMRNGPLVVEGGAQVVNGDGMVLKEGPRVALCRCGHSDRKPFCDGSHGRAGFSAD